MPPQSTRELLKSTSGIAVVFAAPEGEETEIEYFRAATRATSDGELLRVTEERDTVAVYQMEYVIGVRRMRPGEEEDDEDQDDEDDEDES